MFWHGSKFYSCIFWIAIILTLSHSYLRFLYTHRWVQCLAAAPRLCITLLLSRAGQPTWPSTNSRLTPPLTSTSSSRHTSPLVSSCTMEAKVRAVRQCDIPDAVTEDDHHRTWQTLAVYRKVLFGTAYCHLLYTANYPGAQADKFFSLLVGHDFLALELVNGHVHLVFSLGERPFRVRDSNKMALNDNKWHVVTVSRPSSLQHTLLVDDTLTTVTNEGSSDTLDLQGFLYLGECLVFIIFLKPASFSLLFRIFI